MANPTHKHSRSRRDKRRANWKAVIPQLAVCPECKENKLPHRACDKCGYYNGKKIINVTFK